MAENQACPEALRIYVVHRVRRWRWLPWPKVEVKAEPTPINAVIHVPNTREVVEVWQTEPLVIVRRPEES